MGSDTLEEVEPRVQRELIGSMGTERAAELINEMSPAQAADVLAALPADEADELMMLMDQGNVTKVQQIIDQHDENIMLYATLDFLKQPPITMAKDVIDNYRHLARDKEVIMYVYVTDDKDILLGVVDVRELIMADDDQTLAEIMTDHVIRLSPADTLREALENFDRYDFRAIPITDEEDRILSVVSYRNIRGLTPRLD